MKNHLKLASPAACAALILFALASRVEAAEQKVDPTGTWTWTIPVGNGNEIHRSVTLTRKDGKLTGTTRSADEQSAKPLDSVSLKGDELRFQYTVDFNGNSFSPKYSGKITGDKIVGEILMGLGDQEIKRDWEAKRAADATGTWKYSITTRNGREFERTIRLKQEGNKLTGAIVGNQNDTAISGGKIENGEISFTVERERNGQTFTSVYTGKVAGDTIKGQVKSTRNGNERTTEFEAKRQKE